MARNILICHIMQHDNPNKEIGRTKTKSFNQEFSWSKRTFPIDQKAIWTDKKGVSHLHIDVNESDGTFRFLYQVKENIIDDKCVECGGKISIDAKNVRDLIKRKTINAIWGIDNSYVMLLLIMGIVLIALVGALFFVIGELNKTNNTLQKYLPAPTAKATMIIGNMGDIIIV